MSLALIATHYADADKEEINVPFAITNQPWLIKHIMSYDYKTYQKQDKAQHKVITDKLHKELNDYHWACQLHYNSKLQDGQVSLFFPLEKIKLLGRLRYINDKYVNVWPHKVNKKVPCYLLNHDGAPHSDFYITIEGVLFDYTDSYDISRGKFPGIDSYIIPVVNVPAQSTEF
jgi:hypothetical protein|tara:strand:- start:59 stop:577 length:519 start_codon:yes stop_codon:yes gene_type:complete